MASDPTHVRISSAYGYAGSQLLWFRQTPNNDGVWGELAAHLDEGDVDADWVVAINEPFDPLTTTAPIERRILFIAEPPGVQDYPARYANQFGVVVSPYAIPGFRGRTLIQQSALYWHYGLDQRGGERLAAALKWADLAADKPKSKLASVICSSKTLVPHQHQRLAFVDRLMSRLGDRIDRFGNGVQPINDKQDAIGPYKYHIVLENNTIDHFWTEKLGDAYLGDAFPIYAGCANIETYFDGRSLRRIDIFDPDRAVDEVARLLDSTTWEDSRDYVREARRRVMNEHNLFPVIAKIIADSDPSVRSAGRVARTRVKATLRRRIKKFRRGLRDSLRRAFAG